MPIIKTDKEMRPRDPNDYYRTPEELINFTLNKFRNELSPGRVRRILEPGSGPFAPWGRGAKKIWPDARLDAVESVEPPHGVDYVDRVYAVDYAEWSPDSHYDLVVGNPPYRYAEKFVRRGFDALTGRGHLIYLLRTAFLESDRRVKDLWRSLPPSYVWVLAQRPSFYQNGKTNATCYSVFVWGGESGRTRLDWLDWR